MWWIWFKNILLYIGGNIGSSSEEWEKTEKRFKEMGFDRIYKPGTPIEETIIDLKKDFEVEKWVPIFILQ